MGKLILKTNVTTNGGRMYISIPKHKEIEVNPLWTIDTEMYVCLPDGTYLFNGTVKAQKTTMWWLPVLPDVRREFGLKKHDAVLVYLEDNE